MKLTSFDVFDTLLVRAVASPESALFLLGHQLGRDPEAFVDARRRAEADEWRAAREGGAEVTLAAIHARLEQAAPEEELALERRLLSALPGATERVARARAAGAVAFLSDTPLPGTFVRELLEREALARPDDLLLVSSDCDANKADGALFRLLLERTGLAPHEVLHVGDDADHDVAAARAVGLSAERSPAAAPNRYETLLDRGPTLSRALAGAARLARLRGPATNADERALRDVTAGVVAPLLTGYVLWLLGRARARRLSTLWFLGRDGQVLLELARRLAPRLGVTSKLRYLHASRQAWNLPAFACGAHAGLDWIRDRTDGLSVRTLFARVGLTPEELAPELRAHGLDDADHDRPLSAVELRELEPFLTAEPFRRRVEVQAQERKRVVQRHLADVGLLEDSNPGVVELTGHGNLQESLTALLVDAGGPQPHGFYCVRMDDGRARAMRAPEDWHTTDGVASKLFGIGGGAVVALESFCAADHGTLVGYRVTAEGVEPELAQARNEPVVAWGLPLVRRTLVAFADALLLDGDLVDAEGDVRAETTAALRALWLEPTLAEARAWGAFPFEDGFGTQARFLPLARPRGPGDVWSALRRGCRRSRHRASWTAAEDRLTPDLLRAAESAALRLSRAARRVLARGRP